MQDGLAILFLWGLSVLQIEFWERLNVTPLLTFCSYQYNVEIEKRKIFFTKIVVNRYLESIFAYKS